MSFNLRTILNKRGGSARTRLSVQLLVGAIAVLPVLGIGAPAHAASSTTQLAQVKPVPVAPNVTSNVPKPATAPRALTTQALAAWSVSLSASSTSLWPTQYSTLTANSNMNVGPTPYYIRIQDTTTGSYVAICGTGTTCSASVTQPTATTHSYRASIDYYSGGGLQAQSPYVTVNWRSISVGLSASPTTLGVYGTSTLTATTSSDVGPTPFYTEIFDANTGTRVGVCGFGTSCSANVSQSVATTHRYVAYVSNYSTANPPTGVQATSSSSFITWTWGSFRISLSAPSFSYGSATATATVNQNVGPTPYWIEIFNQNGTRLAVCGSGTTCSATFSPAFGGTRLVAFVSSYDTAYPPANIQASSNVTSTSRLIIFTPVATATSVRA